MALCRMLSAPPLQGAYSPQPERQKQCGARFGDSGRTPAMLALLVLLTDRGWHRPSHLGGSLSPVRQTHRHPDEQCQQGQRGCTKSHAELLLIRLSVMTAHVTVCYFFMTAKTVPPYMAHNTNFHHSN
jgi:hypothetical protein